MASNAFRSEVVCGICKDERWNLCFKSRKLSSKMNVENIFEASRKCIWLWDIYIFYTRDLWTFRYRNAIICKQFLHQSNVWQSSRSCRKITPTYPMSTWQWFARHSNEFCWFWDQSFISNATIYETLCSLHIRTHTHTHSLYWLS